MKNRIDILIVEDNPGDLELIREMLTEPGAAGFNIESAQKLCEATTRLHGSNIDLVLLDLGLPDSSGIDTFFKLKAAAPEVPAIILTGNTDQETGLAAVQEGAQDYLIKGEIDGKLLARSIRYSISP